MKIPYVNALLYVAISILLVFATIFKLRRLIVIYKASNYKIKQFIKNKTWEFFLLDFIILFSIYITFIKFSEKENIITLLILIILSIFYVSLLLRNVKERINYKDSRKITKFIFLFHFLFYMLGLAIFIYFFGIKYIFYVSFYNAFFITYLFIIRISLDKFYLKLSGKKYLKKLKKSEFKNNLFIACGNLANSFKNLVVVSIFKKYNLTTNLESLQSKAELFEKIYLLKNKKNSIISINDFSFIKDLIDIKNINFILFNPDDKTLMDLGMKNDNKDSNSIICLINNKVYNLSNSSDFKIRKCPNNTYDLCLNSMTLKNFKTNLFSELNLKLVASVHLFYYLTGYKYKEFENNNVIDYFKVSTEEDVKVIDFSSYLDLDLISTELKKIDNLKIVGLIDFYNFLEISQNYIKKVAKLASLSFDGVIFLKKRYNNVFLNNLIENKRLKHVHFARFPEDCINKAFSFYEKKPYVLVRINFIKEII